MFGALIRLRLTGVRGLVGLLEEVLRFESPISVIVTLVSMSPPCVRLPWGLRYSSQGHPALWDVEASRYATATVVGRFGYKRRPRTSTHDSEVAPFADGCDVTNPSTQVSEKLTRGREGVGC